MLQQEKPDDYILATGQTNTVKEFVGWVEEVTGRPIKILSQDDYNRPTDVPMLKGNPSKAKEKLGWVAKTRGKDLVNKMI